MRKDLENKITKIYYEGQLKNLYLFISLLGKLLDCLLTKIEDLDWCNHMHSVDGVLLVKESKNPDHFMGEGTIVLLPNQDIEPVQIEIHFDENRSSFKSATILFGAIGSSRPEYGSPKHEKFNKSFYEEPNTLFDWKYQFLFQKGNWQTKNLEL